MQDAQTLDDAAARDARREKKRDPARDALLIGIGWFGTSMALDVSRLPFELLLKERVGLDATYLSSFKALANIPIYVKPFAGILSDAVPLLGTRRRHYLISSLLFGALFWVLLAIVPRSYHTLLWTYFVLNIFLTLTSTVLGGLMVEVGKRDNATGRLSAQRVGITRIVGMIAGPLGGFLAKQAFLLAMLVCGTLHLALVPLFYFFLHERRTARPRMEVLADVARQFRALVTSKTLWSAAGLIVLVIAAPGFGTPLLYYQRDELGFSAELIGVLAAVAAGCSAIGAYAYGRLCPRFNLRTLLALSIVQHAVLTLLYLFYRSWWSAVLITGVEAMTMVLAVLPLYDLAARATPKGSEALGYSLMMSVWNFTNAMSDVAGSLLHDRLGFTFSQLVWVNSATTLLVLIAVPFLPSVLVDRRDGDVG